MSYQDYQPRDQADWPTFLDDDAKEALKATVREALADGPLPLYHLVEWSCRDHPSLKGVAVMDARFAAVERACRAVADPVWKLKEDEHDASDDFFRWVVAFEVDETWVADGFDLDDERALDMLASDLGYANPAIELSARVIAAPSEKRIKKAQGY